MTNLETLCLFLNEATDGWDSDGTFIADSPAHNAAIQLGMPIAPVDRGTLQPDIFTPDPQPAFSINYDRYTGQPPFNFGGDPIEIDDKNGYSNPIGFDESKVLIQCPRGLCIIKRTAYANGWRHCPGC